MSYVKINGEEQHYNVKIRPFTTQHSHDAIRFVGDVIPETDKGFKYYSDDDKLLADFSDYTYLYRDNEYSVAEDIIEYPAPNNTSDESYDPIGRYLSQINQRISEITPYTESKQAYIDDTECVFENIYKEGALTVNVVDKNGISINYEVVKDENNIIVTFEPLEEVATVSIVIQ